MTKPYALEVAKKAHENQTRKGTDIPYITHPIRVADTLKKAEASFELVEAGYLHDVIEDTDLTEQDLRELFSQKTIDIIVSHSEDKSKSWEERKQHTIDSMLTGTQETVWLVLADKLDNLKETVNKGNDWSLFKRGKKEQFWYHNGILQNAKSRTDIELPEFIHELESVMEQAFSNQKKN